MAKKNYIDPTGLAYAFGKIKAHVTSMVSNLAKKDLSNVDSTTLATAVKDAGVAASGVPIPDSVAADSFLVGNGTETMQVKTAEEVLALIKALPLVGGELTGELIVNENFQVRKTFNDVKYRSYIRPVNYELGGEYCTGLIHYDNEVNVAQVVFNRHGMYLRDNVDGVAAEIFGTHNLEKSASNLLHRSNAVHQANTDYGTYMARAIALSATEVTPSVNGAVALIYQE